MKGMLKGPLIIAAILVVGRVVLERAGAPGWLNNLLSVVVLYVFIAPLYFAFRIANSGIDRPYRTLFKKIALFTALARSMVIPTYWLAYHYQWPEFRFCVAADGVRWHSGRRSDRMDPNFARCRRRPWVDRD